jgi:hypothetical protein
MSRTEACITFSIARSLRYAECQGEQVSEDELSREVIGCPDKFFSDSTVRTVDGLLDCAEQYRTFSCDLLLAGRYLDCMTPGTRAGGEPCAFSTQCQALVCDRDVRGTCGRCGALVARGGACGGQELICALNDQCVDGICVERATTPPPPIMEVPEIDLPTGAACENHAECTGEELCFDGVCTARVPIGGSCSGPTQYCDDVVGYCDRAVSICRALPTEGLPCGINWDEPVWCAEHLRCDTSDPDNAVCVLQPGVECLAAGMECPAATYCCAAPDCAEPTCMRILLPHEACGAADARCIEGTECTAGRCEPIDSTGADAKMCP